MFAGAEQLLACLEDWEVIDWDSQELTTLLQGLLQRSAPSTVDLSTSTNTHATSNNQPTSGDARLPEQQLAAKLGILMQELDRAWAPEYRACSKRLLRMKQAASTAGAPRRTDASPAAANGSSSSSGRDGRRGVAGSGAGLGGLQLPLGDSQLLLRLKEFKFVPLSDGSVALPREAPVRSKDLMQVGWRVLTCGPLCGCKTGDNLPAVHSVF